MLSFYTDSWACVRMGNDVSEGLFENDTALVADSEEKLCRLVSELSRVCEKES